MINSALEPLKTVLSLVILNGSENISPTRLFQIYIFLVQEIFPAGMSLFCLVDCTCLVLFFFTF